MATYVIGDLQGHYDGLIELLEKCNYNSQEDELYLAGDLVNRGPQSLEVLRYCKEHSIKTVLGNHDLYFIRDFLIHQNDFSKWPSYFKTMLPVIEAEDKFELVRWLCNQPLMHSLEVSNKHFYITHAGLYPHWTPQQAQALSDEASHIIKNAFDNPDNLEHMPGDDPKNWQEDLLPHERFRFIINAFTRMRCLENDTDLEFSYKESAPTNKSHPIQPWFKLLNLKENEMVLFGHWAALLGRFDGPNHMCLDLGYDWGGRMKALRLDDMQSFTIQS